jgi:hypothetical protein
MLKKKNDIETEKFCVNFLNLQLNWKFLQVNIQLFLGSRNWLWRGYPDLTYGGNGFIYIISPFADFQQKYNLNKRNEKTEIR